MSNIVIDARELRTSSGRYVERLLFYLQKIDKENIYNILLKPGDIDGWTVSNDNFKKIACPYKEFTFSEQLALKRLINNLNPDLVHFTFPQQPALYRGRVVTTFHDLTTLRFNNPSKKLLAFKFKQKVYSWLIKKVARKSKAILVPSNYVKEDVNKYTKIDANKITVTYESADLITDKIEPVPSLSESKFIMYIGRPTPHKNIERLIEAHQLLRLKYPDLLLVLAGKADENYRKIKQIVESNGYENIIFTGYVSEGQLKWLYENCQAYVFPSLSEGFGLPGLEAMTHGAPVVSSNATCLPEIYGDAALYFDPLNVNAIKNTVDKVLSNKSLRNDLINKGYEQARKYSWEKMASETLDIYKEALV